MAQETKSVSVSPSAEQNEIDIWGDFGWSLQSSQQVYNKDSHIEQHFGNNYSVTETTNFVKLVFTRNTSMLNYKEIRALETEFDSIKNQKIPGPYFGGKWILAFVLSAGLCIPLFIILKLINMPKCKAAKNHNQQAGQRRAELRRQARALLE